jgi:hypothetical protein
MTLRLLAIVLLITFATSFGCSTWTAMPVNEKVTEEEAESLIGKRAKFYMIEGVQEIKVRSVDYPFVHGAPYQAGKERTDKTQRIDLDHVKSAEVLRRNRMKTIALLALAVGGVAAIAWAISEGTSDDGGTSY